MNDTSDSTLHNRLGYLLDRTSNCLADSRGRLFDPATKHWSESAAPVRQPPMSAQVRQPPMPIGPFDAVSWLQRQSGHPLRVPIGVVGPRDANPVQMDVSQRIGEGLAGMGLSVICGGRHGVMEAVAKGVRAADGVCIGLLPDATPEPANPWLTHVLATGLGEARNALIARSAFCLVVIGDSYGTLSEVALGLQFGKRVFGLEGAARVHGVEHLPNADAALRAVAGHILG